MRGRLISLTGGTLVLVGILMAIQGSPQPRRSSS
jgi:hypothetical protein